MTPESVDSESDTNEAVHTRNLHQDDVTPTTLLIETVADLKGMREIDLAALPEHLGHCIEQLETDPPPIETHPELTFTYEGYRITVYRDGTCVFQDQRARAR